MCGIAGLWLGAGSSLRDKESVLRAVTDAQVHRGPDGAGYWWDPTNRVGLGHRRLAIVDLTPTGHQPMASHSRRFTMTFNGEIYNFRALRGELVGQGHRFVGESDTEVMLAAFEQWGVRKSIERFNGMFAFAVFDAREQTLTLGRDRLGKKPLYFTQQQDVLAFSSELKALRRVPGLRFELDYDALASFLRFAYVPTPWTVFRNVRKLDAGATIEFRRDVAGTLVESLGHYWAAEQVFQRGSARPFRGDYREALNELDHLLRDAVALRMIADVPLGAFLSGGIDSSAVVALMQAQSTARVKTFAIGFFEDAYNEAQHAKGVAEHLGTDHTELYVTPAEAREVIPLLPTVFDEPFADSSQIPTYLVSKLARQHVTVALSGDGGDELLCGYNRYFLWEPVWRVLGRVPLGARAAAGRALAWLSPNAVDRMVAGIQFLSRRKMLASVTSDRVRKFAGLLAARNPDELFLRMLTHWSAEQRTLRTGAEYAEPVQEFASYPASLGFATRMQLHDVRHYLPDDILVKVDRASMAVSLEARAPLLDYRLMEFAATLPHAFKAKDGIGKLLLKDMLYQYVPRELLERPKTGFGVPIDSWLRGPLREWAEDLISECALERDQIFVTGVVRKAWQDHLDSRAHLHYGLWTILMFQAWLRAWGLGVVR
jgi:asparagine synthase (glutamine-hydrolysing)